MASDAVRIPTQGKNKTKAKQRYLKRKKERRKLRTTHTSQDAIATADDHDKIFEGSEDEPEHEVEDGVMQQEKKHDSSRSRPTKRRRAAEATDDVVPMEVTSFQEGNDVGTNVQDLSPPRPKDEPSSTPPPLPVFPLPTLPEAPSKSTLALQGLDKAFIEAEVVDPFITLSVPPEGPDDGGTRLSEKMRKRLHDIGITELFAVQTALLPFLVPFSKIQRRLCRSTHPIRDVCVSAPTGSGKTLAYVLPIIEILSSRIVTQLRALIVLPTRDLVSQVRETFEVLGRGRGLKIGTATGQHSFAHEQAHFIRDQSPNLLGGSSKVDILICTPGRLIDHLNGTSNFTLQHLRFLVIDEADRLLAQSFQDWLAQVLAAIRSPTFHDSTSHSGPPDPTDIVAPSVLRQLPFSHSPTFLSEADQSSCQKLLFSATLTNDPGKIAALELTEPKYFIVQRENQDGDDHTPGIVTERFSMPATLQEHMIVCEPSQKPLAFFHLVYEQNVIDALVFTKSAESTARLVQLFDFFQKHKARESSIVVRAYSSDLSVSERKTILQQFKAQEIHILVCSDLISRGLDINHVSNVISYDVPIDMRKYVHRVGRTARAGRTGRAWTLVEEQEARYFKDVLRDAGHLERVKRLRISSKDLAPLAPGYEVALKQLKDAYTRW